MARDPSASFTVAPAQASPVFLDRDTAVVKARRLILQAEKAGAHLVAFLEAYIPCYPDRVLVIPPGKSLCVPPSIPPGMRDRVGLWTLPATTPRHISSR